MTYPRLASSLRRLSAPTIPAFALLLVAVFSCAPSPPKPQQVNAPPLSATASAVSTAPATYLVIRVTARRLDLMQQDVAAPIASFPIAVGRPGHETPTGQFHVEEMVEYPEFLKIDPNEPTKVLKRFPPGGPENPLGERWIGFAHGDGWVWTVGIHGTPHPELLGQAVSGGCIRMRNADVVRVYEQVAIGTPVIVHP
jgi:lipoprotein-anchoring transpeptidase ErfK/SrfK